MKERLIGVWRRNQLANEQVLDEADEQIHLVDTSIKKVYAQLAHIHTIRYYNIEKQNKMLLNDLVKLSAKNADDRELVRSQLQQSTELIAHLINFNDEFRTINGYKNGLLGWIVYLINHESHHRCKAMMQLRSDRVKLSKRLKFDIWNWK